MPGYRRRVGVLLATCILASWPATSHQVVVKAARYFDTASGKLVSPAVIVVSDGMIAAVNPGSVPDQVPAIDLGELTLLPGLIDVHTHLTQDFTGNWRLDTYAASAADLALRGAAAARKTLQAGFTTVRDLGANEFADIALMNAVDQDLVPGPDIIAAGHAIGISGGHCDGIPVGHRLGESGPLSGAADGVDEVVKAVRLQLKHGAKVIKICVTAGVISMGKSNEATQMSAAEIAAAVEEAHRQGVRVAAHAHGAAGILAAANGGVDSIEHASFMTPEALRVVLRKRIVLVPNLYLLQAFDISVLPADLREQALRLKQSAQLSFRQEIAAGVMLALGTDAAVVPHGSNARELTARVAQGEPAKDALLDATIHGAELLGLDDRGTIAHGKRADLIAVAGDPLADISTAERVLFVMKKGRVIRPCCDVE